MNKLARPLAEISGPAARISIFSYQSMTVFAAGIDAVAILLASVLGFAIYNYYAFAQLSISQDSVDIGATVAVFFVILSIYKKLYHINVLLHPDFYSKIIAVVITISFLCLIGVIFLLKVGGEYSRGSIILFAASTYAFVIAGRLALARFSALAVKNGVVAGRRAVTVGEASELEKLPPHELRRFGIEEIARVGVIQRDRSKGLGETGRAQVAGAIDLARDLRAVEFVLMIPWSWDRLVAEVGDLLRPSPLSVKLLPDSTMRAILSGQRNGELDLAQAVEIQREPLDRWERFCKRVLDISLSLTAIVLLAPLFVMTAVAIKLDSKGPILFRQRRVGFDNAEFVIFKFRSMTVLDDGAKVVQARRGDARVTRIGALLRRSSIDELPQLFNVVRGDMSLVGPRPHAVAHHDQYRTLIASYAFRHHVKPGLTGMAQVRGLRGETPQLAQMELRVEQDLWYINHWSLRLDLMILARTCGAVLRHEVY